MPAPRQPDLLQAIAPPVRKPRRVIAHAFDGGDGMPGLPFGAQFECSCGWRSDWLCFATASEISRGTPCPECNAPAGGQAKE